MSDDSDEIDPEFDDDEEYEGPNPYDEPEDKKKEAEK
jgi:hypothetical protein